jgi:hypothetical protein
VIGEALAVAARRLGKRAPGVLARLAGPLGDETRGAAEHLGDKASRISAAAAARAPVPPAFRLVHPTWIEAVLEELPPRARQALAGGEADRVDVWLARWATAELPPTIDLPRDDVTAWLLSIGHDQVAFALGITQALAIPVLVNAARRITKPPRVGQLGLQRAAILRCTDVDPTDEVSIIRIAGRALAPHFATDQLARLALTRRLPRPIGLLIERELDAHAATLFDQCPTWEALTAP